MPLQWYLSESGGLTDVIKINKMLENVSHATSFLRLGDFGGCEEGVWLG